MYPHRFKTKKHLKNLAVKHIKYTRYKIKKILCIITISVSYFLFLFKARIDLLYAVEQERFNRSLRSVKSIPVKSHFAKIPSEKESPERGSLKATYIFRFLDFYRR